MIARPAAAAPADDPIHAVIDAHRDDWAAYSATIRRLGHTRCGSRRDAERVAARDLYWSQCDALLTTFPTTAAGLLALSEYFAGFTNEQEPPVPLWLVMETVAQALKRLELGSNPFDRSQHAASAGNEAAPERAATLSEAFTQNPRS